MVTLAVRNTFAGTDLVESDPLNENFEDVETVVNGGITSNNLDPNAGITATQLADRYASILPTSFNLIPSFFRSNGAMAYVGSIVPPSSFANDYYTVPVTGTWGEVDRCYPPLDTGQEAYLTKAELYVIGQQANAGSNPQFRIRKNGTLVLGGGEVTIDTDSIRYELTNADPSDDPQASIVNGDYLTFEFSSSGAAAGYLLGVSLKLYWKVRFTN
jgi:hypothetical protein